MASTRGPANSAPARRLRIALSCSVCGNRNYRSTKNRLDGDTVNLKKFCKNCNQHTTHIEAK